MLPEAQRAIAKLIDDKVAEFRGEREELAKSLALLNIVYNTFPVNTEQKQEPLQKLLNKTGFKLEDLAVIFEALNRQGLASRFINKPPYVIIYDVNAFKKAVIEIIEQLYSQAQQQCYGC